MVTPDDVAYAVAAVVLALFGAWLLFLSPRQRATRALAALLFGMAVAWGDEILVEFVAPETYLSARWALIAATFSIGLSTIFFLSAYPRPRGWLGRSRWGGWATVAVGVALAALVAARPELVSVVEVADGALRLVDLGPLVLVGSLWTTTAVAMLYLFALDLRRAPAGPLRRAMLLVFAGFMTSILVWTGSLVLNDVSGRLPPGSIVMRYSRLTAVIEEASFFLALGAVAIVLASGWRAREPTVRREAHALAGLVAACLASVLVVGLAFAPPAPGSWTSVAQGILDAAGGAAIAAFAGYALLKHRLFDIEVKLKWTIRRGTVAAVFIAVFLAAAEIAQSFLSETQGYLAGGIAAGLLLFGVVPLQRWAERVADKALPAVHDSEDWRVQKKRDLYRMAVGVALADRVVSRDEERHLARLAQELGLGAAEALEIREEVEKELGLAAPA